MQLAGQSLDAGWRYDAARNELVFEPVFAPAPGMGVSAHYTAACTP